MAYFDKTFLKFLQDLSKNNNRDWFNANKSTYIKAVKEPFEDFVSDAIKAAGKIDKEIDLEAKDCIFRIYKDTRFSKDKTPYKTNRTAVISKYGRKNREYPGYYIYAGPDKMMFGGGAYGVEKQALSDIRYAIIDDPKGFQKIISSKEFTETFGELLGEKNKILPKEIKEYGNNLPILYNKQFYVMHDLPANTCLEEDLLERFIKHMKVGSKLNKFLIKAMYS